MSYFIGSFVPKPTADIFWKNRPLIDKVRWVKSERYHITFRYFDELNAGELSTVLDLTEKFANQFPIRCQTKMYSGFPSSQRARVIIVPLVLEEFSLPPELRTKKPFVPHVTVGYARQGRVTVPQHPVQSSFILEKPVLIHSEKGTYTFVREKVANSNCVTKNS
ncbi:MAG: hypothetical protein OXO49_07880 [Gammaproteobacteria bacterium]|nr:hypothetical protein [Gammaproteobacteria bacterium]MDE0251609.1 hypothetical protein [Gammaproteobacteria bacterium]MDE0403381.1 hypothetical protein [Gammaproteobacteria bacterium]